MGKIQQRHDYQRHDYIEWERDARAVPQREGRNDCIEDLFDAEIRRRVGEVIARAADGEKKPKRPAH